MEGVCIEIYMMAAYKVYWVSILAFMLITFLLVFPHVDMNPFPTDVFAIEWQWLSSRGFAEIVALGCVLLIAGAFVAWGVSKLLYRLPMSIRAQTQQLRRMMDA